MPYYNATICLNGHVNSETDSNYSNFCKNCGKENISTCQNCNKYIRGAYFDDYSFETDYQKPFYCVDCSNPYPWTEQLISNAIELISLDEELSESDREIIKNALQDLIVDTPSSPVATAKYKKFIPKAASYVQDGLHNLLVDVVSETVKKSIWG